MKAAKGRELRIRIPVMRDAESQTIRWVCNLPPVQMRKVAIKEELQDKLLDLRSIIVLSLLLSSSDFFRPSGKWSGKTNC